MRPQYIPVSRKQFETIEVNIKRDTGESVPFEFAYTPFSTEQTRILLKSDMKKIHTPNHKLYEQYYLNQARQKRGSLPAFHGARFQQGYGLGSIFRGLFRWAVPHLRQGAKVLGKKALQTGANVAQDVLEGENFNTAVEKRGRQALGLASQKSPQTQAAAGRKAIKRKAQPKTSSSAPAKKRKTTPRKQQQETFKLLS